MPAVTTPRGHALSYLLGPQLPVATAEEREIRHLTLDSREAGPGSLFAALAGQQRHGLEFISDVLQRGASAVLWEPAAGVDAGHAQALCAQAGVPLLQVPQLSQALSGIAGRFYGEPSRGLSLIGVTGTDGKTSTSQFLAQALSENDRPCGVIGTLGYGLLGSLVPASHTTPDAVRVQRLLADMRELGARHAVMEASSHALDQGRVAGLHFKVAVLTNLTRDHLDYHGSEAAYAAAKARLFKMPGLEHAVLNRDDAFGEKLRRQLPAGVREWGYSLTPRGREVAVSCRELRFLPAGLALSVDTPLGSAKFQLGLLGRFNAANALAALTTLLALGWPLERAVVRLSQIEPVAGRMERFGGDGRPLVIVDYAHTPAGLAAALDAVRQHSRGRVWCVFGCGGDRDRGKRPQMADVAERKADEIVLTDDNPRMEDPARIIDDILAGLQTREPFLVRDRAAAIRLAVERAEPLDAVLVAGKGHEDYQIIGERRLPFDDRKIVRLALEERRQWTP
jgi:UDP-N-acetylmuramoyl-L-alanyl-D-glutamate--2,6-diaminopimelate ligase